MLNNILNTTVRPKSYTRNLVVQMKGRVLRERFRSLAEAVDHVKSIYPRCPVTCSPQGDGTIFGGFSAQNRTKIAGKFKVMVEATDKQNEEWQSEKVLNYIEDLFNRAGKGDLVVAREGSQLLLKAQGSVFRVDVEKVM